MLPYDSPPFPMTEEEYEMLCECFGSLMIDEIIEEHTQK